MTERVDVEWHAFTAGLKPAIRLSAAPGEGDAIAARYRAFGAVVVRAEGRVHRADGQPLLSMDLVYVARNRPDAEGLRAAEAPLVSGDIVSASDTQRITREMGRRLGYPECCVERCAERGVRKHLGKRPSGEAPPYQVARDAWVPAPRWQLNDQLFALHAHLISFEPCRYDCDAALRLASSLHDIVSAQSSDSGRGLERVLRRPLAIAADGSVAFVMIDRDGSRGPIVVSASPVQPKHAPFAAALVGLRPNAADGVLDERGSLLLDFGG